MRYNKVRKMDISNGPGVRVSIFMQGCTFKCKNCFNPETHDFKCGKEFSEDTINRRKIYHPMFRCYSNNSTNTELVLNNKDLGLYFTSVNGKKIFSTNKYETNWLGDVIEASAITTSSSFL